LLFFLPLVTAAIKSWQLEVGSLEVGSWQ